MSPLKNKTQDHSNYKEMFVKKKWLYVVAKIIIKPVFVPWSFEVNLLV